MPESGTPGSVRGVPSNGHPYRDSVNATAFSRIIERGFMRRLKAPGGDLSVPGEDFAKLSLQARRVFITENKVNFLAFPQVPDSLPIFGAGYGFEPLAEVGRSEATPKSGLPRLAVGRQRY